MCEFTRHAYDRMSSRLAGIINERQVCAAVFEAGDLPVGQTGIILKYLPQWTIRDGSEGDMVIAVFDRRDRNDPGRVVTVELRGSTQRPSWRWKCVVDVSYLTR